LNQTVEIDEIDSKILAALIRDARAKLKSIAKDCGISSVSALNRIKRLKSLRVITGAILFSNLAALELPIVATIGVNLNGNQEEVIKLIEEKTNAVEISASFGKYDMCALVHAESITELDRIAYSMKKLEGVIKVEINIWTSIPHMVYENIDLQPK
jgi:Lrp/AsnC family leucine-responsive transcriptional regulator